MNSTPNSMVPDVDWGRAASAFEDRLDGPQVILCADCVRIDGVLDTVPPRYVIILNGRSYCPEHYAGVTDG